MPPLSAHVLKAAYWTAARYGLDGQLVDLPGDRALRPAAELLHAPVGGAMP